MAKVTGNVPVDETVPETLEQRLTYLKKEIKEELSLDFNERFNDLYNRIDYLESQENSSNNVERVEESEDGVITHIESDYLLQNKELELLKEQNTQEG